MSDERVQLEPQLAEAKKTLETALSEACSADVENANTGELIRIEETLALANEAAKEAVSIRLRMRTERARANADGVDPRVGDKTIPHRVFDDEDGIRWHVFAVRRVSDSVERAQLPESFRTGWLVFESADELRRLAPVPEDWETLPLDALRGLCHAAAAAPRRTPAFDESHEQPGEDAPA